MIKTMLIIPLLAAAAGPSPEVVALLKARAHGAEAKECLRVVDQDGAPVVGAMMKGGLQTGGGRNDYIPIRGVTDTNGEFVIQGNCTEIMRCSITKDGYYPSEFKIENYGFTHELKDGKWLPYGGRQEVILKRIANPGGLIVFPRSLLYLKRPSPDVWHGFDFELGDWTKPLGKGETDDVLIMFHDCDSSERGDKVEYRYEMKLAFTNHPYAGAYLMRKDLTSKMQTDYSASPTATFLPQFSYYMSYVARHGKASEILDENSYLIYRTRTKVDEMGQLISAHYGVIFGPLRFGANDLIIEDGCFNPIPNDFNIEDGRELRNVLKRQKKETMRAIGQRK